MNDAVGTDVPNGFIDFVISEGFASHIGPIYWKPEKDSCSMGFRVMQHHLNPGGICHGGMMMTLADMAVGFGTAWVRELKCFMPSINNSYDFISSASLGEWLETEMEVIQATKRMGFARGLLKGPNGIVLRFNGIAKIPSETDPRFNDKGFAEQMQKLFDRYK